MIIRALNPSSSRIYSVGAPLTLVAETEVVPEI